MESHIAYGVRTGGTRRGPKLASQHSSRSAAELASARLPGSTVVSIVVAAR